MSDNRINSFGKMTSLLDLDLTHIVTPANPAAGFSKLYFKSDNILYQKTSAGVESAVGVSGGISVGGIVASGTANRVLYENSSNLLAESANLTFSGTQLLVSGGSVSLPSLAWDESDTGFYLVSAGIPALSVNGVKRLQWSDNTTGRTGFNSSANGEYLRIEDLSGGGQVIDILANYGRLSFGGVAQMYWDATGVGMEKDMAGDGTHAFGKSGGNTLTFQSANLATDGVVIGAPNAAGYVTPNYHLVHYQNTAATAVYSQYVIKTTTGITNSDGTIVGLDASGNFKINQQENLTIGLATNGTERWTISAAGQLAGQTVGTGLSIKEGSNAKMGISTLVAGTVTVATTAVTANSRIMLTTQVPGGTVGYVYISARTAATDFTITSLNVLDTSDVAWVIIEPS